MTPGAKAKDIFRHGVMRPRGQGVSSSGNAMWMRPPHQRQAGIYTVGRLTGLDEDAGGYYWQELFSQPDGSWGNGQLVHKSGTGDNAPPAFATDLSTGAVIDASAGTPIVTLCAVVYPSQAAGYSWVFDNPSVGLPCYRVKTVYAEYLACKRWDGTAEGSTTINVAKPWLLRVSVGVSKLLGTAVDAQTINVTVGAVSENWLTWPVFEVNDEIRAIPADGTRVTVSSVPLALEMAADGRMWQGPCGAP